MTHFLFDENLDLPLVFVLFFLKGNKIKKKTLCDFLFEKNISPKIESGSRGQITYYEDMMVNRNTSLSPYTYGIY